MKTYEYEPLEVMTAEEVTNKVTQAYKAYLENLNDCGLFEMIDESDKKWLIRNLRLLTRRYIHDLCGRDWEKVYQAQSEEEPAE